MCLSLSLSLCACQLHHTHRYLATPIAMAPAGSAPSQCGEWQSHAGSQYGRKQLVAERPQPTFAATASLHAAIERPSDSSAQQTADMQQRQVLPHFTAQHTQQRSQLRRTQPQQLETTGRTQRAHEARRPGAELSSAFCTH